MQKISFYKISPGGNITALVVNPSIKDAAERARLANVVMGRYADIEQVGYIKLNGSVPRLDMMGGEFCGNASRSLVALLISFRNDPPSKERWIMGEISVSGVNRSLRTRVFKKNNRIYSWVEMPIRQDDDCVKDIKDGLSVIFLDGITHILLDQCVYPFPDDFKKESAKIRSDLGLNKEDAVGCVWYNCAESGCSIRPVVWVCGTDSTYYETACGSGTTALGLYLAKRKGKDVECEILQPSGKTIAVTVEYSVNLHKYGEAWIGGEVEIMSHEEVLI